MFQIFTFALNGTPRPIEYKNKKYETREAAEDQMLKLKEIYNDVPMFVSEMK